MYGAVDVVLGDQGHFVLDLYLTGSVIINVRYHAKGL